MRKKIEFLDRLFALLKCRSDILQFLKEEKIISDDVMQGILVENHGTHSTKVASLLEDAVKSDKLQLVDYEWTILPVERLRLTVVSQNNRKDFTYGQ